MCGKKRTEDHPSKKMMGRGGEGEAFRSSDELGFWVAFNEVADLVAVQHVQLLMDLRRSKVFPRKR